MNAGTLQLISIIAFSLAGVLTLISIYLFFKMDVRGIIDDLSGKSAERQIMAMREENNRQKNPLLCVPSDCFSLFQMIWHFF